MVICAKSSSDRGNLYKAQARSNSTIFCGSLEKRQCTTPVYKNCSTILHTSFDILGSMWKTAALMPSLARGSSGSFSSSCKRTGLCAPRTTRCARNLPLEGSPTGASVGPTSKATSAKGTRPEEPLLRSSASARCCGTGACVGLLGGTSCGKASARYRSGWRGSAPSRAFIGPGNDRHTNLSTQKFIVDAATWKKLWPEAFALAIAAGDIASAIRLKSVAASASKDLAASSKCSRVSPLRGCTSSTSTPFSASGGHESSIRAAILK
mmetsp:Transcript_74022/g.176202  ORF Transcript_74022/g.176202 Transcript_74022/m.176202 type:complete len:266 (-) Transcript_74022:804-1601(-)